MTLRRRMARARRRARRLANTALATTGITTLLDRAAFAAARPPTPSMARDAAQPGRWHVLVAPPGGGNIGDQAMVEAFLENTTDPVRMLVRGMSDIAVPPEHVGRVEVRVLPALIHGSGRAHRVAVAGFRDALDSARFVTVVGADAMDGAYDVRASVRRADLATLAADEGLAARILGFSWNGAARAGARRALVRAARAGVELLVRDPVSAERARADGLGTVTEVADAVFSARTIAPEVVEEVLGAGTPGAAPPPYAVVNASGLVARSLDQVGEYASIVRHLLDTGIHVVLLPHVVRSSASDLAACRRIAERVDDPRVVLVDRMLSPAEVRGLCRDARVVLAGRMHLAIQALWSGVPALTLSTQGKVEGLMQLFGTESLCVVPTAGLGERVATLLDEVLDRRDWYGAQITGRLPAVRRLARLNFPPLTERAPTPALEQETT